MKHPGRIAQQTFGYLSLKFQGELWATATDLRTICMIAKNMGARRARTQGGNLVKRAFNMHGAKETSVTEEIWKVSEKPGKGWCHKNNTDKQFCGKIHKQLWR